MSEQNDFATRLAEAQAELRHIGKDARNNHHKYDYTSIEGAAAAVNKALTSRGIASSSDTMSCEWDGKSCVVGVRFMLWDKLHDDFAEFALNSGTFYGAGQDSDPSKAIAKAYSCARKNYYFTFFNIARGEDHDADEAPGRAQPRQEARSAPRTAATDGPPSAKERVWNLALEAIGTSDATVRALEPIAQRYGNCVPRELGEVHWQSILKDMSAMTTIEARKQWLTS